VLTYTPDDLALTAKLRVRTAPSGRSPRRHTRRWPVMVQPKPVQQEWERQQRVYLCVQKQTQCGPQHVLPSAEMCQHRTVTAEGIHSLMLQLLCGAALKTNHNSYRHTRVEAEQPAAGVNKGSGSSPAGAGPANSKPAGSRSTTTTRCAPVIGSACSTSTVIVYSNSSPTATVSWLTAFVSRTSVVPWPPMSPFVQHTKFDGLVWLAFAGR
jgi:hypothetical protein